MQGKQPTHPSKQITTVISEEVFVKLHAAKLFARKTIGVLIGEGCAIIAERYRTQRLAERVSGFTAPDAPPERTAAARKVTARLSDDLYLSLWSARHYSGRTLRDLAAEGCTEIADHYWRLRIAERDRQRGGQAA